MPRSLVLGSPVLVTLLVFACGESSRSAPIAELSADASSDSTPVTDAADAAESLDGEPVCPTPYVFGNAACRRCMNATCCSVIATCHESAACDALLRCVLDCVFNETDSEGCRNDCIDRIPDGEDGFLAVDDCWAALAPKGCAEECAEVQ